MKAVIADMTVSTGGVLRLNKSLMHNYDIHPGDRIIMLQDTENSKITLQIQREAKILLRLEGAELIQIE